MIMSIWQEAPSPIMILAPMDDVTDTVFRQVVHSCAPADIYFTEFVNVDGLVSVGRKNLLKKLKFNEKEGPLVAQIWGLKPENFEIIARQIADGTLASEIGLSDGFNFVGIDLNMGCPAKSEVKSGACSALIKNRKLAREIILSTKKGAGDMSVSVKTRLGYNEIDMTWIEFLLGFNLNAITVHWRTKKEMSNVPAQWDKAKEVVRLRNKIAPITRIIGNGDVLTRKQGEALAREYDLDGIMVGRGVFGDPFVFAKRSTWQEFERHQRIDLFINHVKLFVDTWGEAERTRPIYTLNKFCKIYIQGFPGAKELREKFMSAKSAEELMFFLRAAKKEYYNKTYAKL